LLDGALSSANSARSSSSSALAANPADPPDARSTWGCAPGAGEHEAPSLRRRLLWLIVGVVLLASLMQALGVYRIALDETEAVFDSQMQRMALSLSGGLAGPNEDTSVLDGEHAQDWIVQIWRADGTMLYRSASARLLPQQAVLGFSNVSAHGRRFRVYAIQTPRQVIQVAQTELSRKELASKLALRTMAPVAWLLPLCLLLVWWVIARAFAPLERARASLARRSIADLSPLPREDMPEEVQPLLREVNGLLGRLDHAWQTQQRFVADAAHELRSPLAALRLQAQSLQRAQAPEQREVAMQRLVAGIDRATRMVEQLLALARQEGTQITPASHCEVDATAQCERVLADMEPLARARHITLSASQLDAVQLHGHADGFVSLVRNLVENAIRYTPEGGQVRLSLQRQLIEPAPAPKAEKGSRADPVRSQANTSASDLAALESEGASGVQRAASGANGASGAIDARGTSGASDAGRAHGANAASGSTGASGASGARALLTVDDSGPGIAPAERERVFDRFYRVPGSAPGGSGLGLAIVKTIAQGLGGQVSLGESALGGLRVQVDVPCV
jgi:two-component system OmpR family sensor kinase